MKKTFVYKVTKAALLVLHVFGASAFLLTIMALCGVPMSRWVGVCTALPGWLIIKWLMELCANEIRKMMEVGSREAFAIVDDGKEESEDCRFHEGGKCTFGDGLPECAKEQSFGGGTPILSGSVIVSCEDASTKYMELPDGLRLIFREGKYVGWYVSGEEGGGKDA